MTNTSLLQEYIKKSGYKKGFIIDSLGLSRYGFNLKCNNKAEFKASEIETLCNLLKIDTKNRMAIFFAK
jgi:hypothetical protein